MGSDIGWLKPVGGKQPRETVDDIKPGEIPKVGGYMYIYIYMYCTWIHGLSWVDGRAGCVVISQETMGIA